ncbi:hypothetical protein [Roseivirga echinicomitans]|uniref:DUF2953 domain-containing protein n=1 Tax=Roseivirga echinicomitans TaxID=296218 RepID=A0A150XUM3_9BACT|nr:hypothetical protein [Roseivirga echinicomitans]KYG82458.1 hypothetical protein AWN68_14470 [Roseivirga echinicomitans]
MDKGNEVFWPIIALFLIITTAIAWVLFTPVMLVCNTTTNTYELSQLGTFSARVIRGEKMEVEFRIFGIKFKPTQDKKTNKKRKKKKSWASSHPLRLARGCMKGVIVKKLTLDIDTGDVITNANLVPVAFFLTNTSQDRFIHINFEGRLLAHLEVKIKLYIILIAIIKNKLKR